MKHLHVTRFSHLRRRSGKHT